MSLKDDKQQNIQIELDFFSARTGEARRAGREGAESSMARNGTENPASTNRLMEAVCARENLKAALRHVKANQGSPGVDGMTVGGIKDYLKQHGPAIREQLLNGTYEPKPIRRVEIPKPDGGVRKLGIPTVLDRFIQQAVMQVLQKAVGPDVLRSQLRVPAGTVGSSSGGTGAAVHRRRPRLVRGSRFGEILGSGQSRQTDGSDRQTGRGPAATETHPGILEYRGDGKRVGQPERGRDSARGTTFATAQQLRARRTRPRTGAPGTSLRSLRG